MHMSGDFELAGDFVFCGQDVHMLAPTETENVLGGHASHFSVSPFMNVPALHTTTSGGIALHEDAPKPLVNPVGHSRQVVLLTAPTLAE